MKLLTHPVVTALGLTYLCLIGLAGPLVSPSHTHIYHLSGPSSAIFVPVIVYFFLLWLLLTILLVFVSRHRRIGVVFWSTILFFGPWVVFRNYAKLTARTVPHRVSVSILTFLLASFIIFLWSWRRSYYTWFKQVQGFLTVLFGFASLTGVLLLGQLLWFNWQASSLNYAPFPLHQRSSTATIAKPRIVWIMMDELSYKQVYEDRFPRLKLPAFDELASGSTIFTDVVPAGNFTDVVIPSLIVGSQADRIRSSSDGRELILHNPVTGKSQVFDSHQTIFQDALQGGYSTAVAGWFNPYCRILNEVLDRCFWTTHGIVSGSIADQQSIKENISAPLKRLIASVPSLFHLHHGINPRDVLEAQRHIIDFQMLSIRADEIIADPTAGFLFVHMPIPHPPGIYDRQHAVFTTSNSSYIDNLALADKFIAHVRSMLERQGQWDSSAIVVMGDHSWRTALWVPADDWTAEDGAASQGGQFDNRPAYIVKMPYQKTPAHVDSHFPAIRTRALLDGIIDGRLKTADDLAAWAAVQR